VSQGLQGIEEDVEIPWGNSKLFILLACDPTLVASAGSPDGGQKDSVYSVGRRGGSALIERSCPNEFWCITNDYLGKQPGQPAPRTCEKKGKAALCVDIPHGESGLAVVEMQSRCFRCILQIIGGTLCIQLFVYNPMCDRSHGLLGQYRHSASCSLDDSVTTMFSRYSEEPPSLNRR
jgi:hypothetical protein